MIDLVENHCHDFTHFNRREQAEVTEEICVPLGGFYFAVCVCTATLAVIPINIVAFIEFLNLNVVRSLNRKYLSQSCLCDLVL